MRTLIVALNKSLSLISKMGGSIGAALIVITAVIITVNCVARYVYNRPMMFVDEYSCYMLVALVYCGLGATLRAGKHVYVDMFVGKLPARVQRTMTTATLGLGVVPVAIMCWYSWKGFWSNYTGKIVSLTPLQTPLWFPYLTVAIGLTIFLFDIIAIVGQRLASVPHGQDSVAPGSA
jgi:TRAP-type C4-dicarboxylate transport system permease small subunit